MVKDESAASENPASLDDLVGRRIGMASRAVRGLLDDVLARYEITFATWLMLSAASRGSLIQRDLACALGVEGPTVVRKLDALETAGLLERTADPEDRRATRVRLTEAGRTLYEQLRAEVDQIDRDLMAPFTAEEREVLLGTLVRIAERATALRGVGKRGG